MNKYFIGNVDFPEPEGPRRTTTSPSFISISMSFKTSSFPKLFFKFLTTTLVCFEFSNVYPPFNPLCYPG